MDLYIILCVVCYQTLYTIYVHVHVKICADVHGCSTIISLKQYNYAYAGSTCTISHTPVKIKEHQLDSLFHNNSFLYVQSAQGSICMYARGDN